jgi:threonine aldolase
MSQMLWREKPAFVDVRSDTVTHPTREMYEAMASAKVGDDVFQDDPTVNELERMTAEITGKECDERSCSYFSFCFS